MSTKNKLFAFSGLKEVPGGVGHQKKTLPRRKRNIKRERKERRERKGRKDTNVRSQRRSLQRSLSRLKSLESVQQHQPQL